MVMNSFDQIPKYERAILYPVSPDVSGVHMFSDPFPRKYPYWTTLGEGSNQMNSIISG
jgi:hypothetical protein